MLKNWKKLLKSFPVNGLNQEVAESKNNIQKSETAQLKQAVLTEIKEIKQEIFEQASAPVNDELKLLGELLKSLRQSRSMSLLMLCRQIKNLEIQGNMVFVHSEDSAIGELVSNDKYKQELDLFFKQRGLSFSLYEQKKEVSAVDVLKEMLGGKLVIK